MQSQVTPESILRLMSGFMAAQHLMVASEAGLFEQLGEGGASLQELSEMTGLPWRSVRILADAMVACGVLAKSDGRYRNSPESFTFLSGQTPADLRPLLRMAHKVQYPGWAEFEEAIRKGGKTREWYHMSSEEQRIMSEGIEAESTGSAAMLAEAYDFGGFRRLLDAAGGTGNHVKILLERYTNLHATLFELPAVAEMASDRLAALVQSGRAQVTEGDLLNDELPAGHDVVLMSHIIHAFKPEQNRELLQRVRGCVEPGARLLILDFWTNAAHTEPVMAALIAGEFYRTVGGDVYSVDEGREWLGETGWKFLAHHPLNGPTTFIEAEAV